MNIASDFIPQSLEGPLVRLEPYAMHLKEEVRAAIDCDPDTWALLPMNAQGFAFEDYWAATCNASPSERVVYAIRCCCDGVVAGTSTYYIMPSGYPGICIQIGTTFIRPSMRGGYVNPATKKLMLAHAFEAGFGRVEFRVDARNHRSQAAMKKLGAVQEGVLRCDLRTWTGHVRNTVIFSILKQEWPQVCSQLDARLAKHIGPPSSLRSDRKSEASS